MDKQLFYFVFPQSGETMAKEMNPLAVKDAAVKYLKTQNGVRGDICIIRDSRENVIAMGYVSDSMKVSFFTGDETVNGIKPTGSRDCDGTPVYEHDLLRCEKTGSIFEVVWNQDNTSFSLVDTEFPVLYPANTLGRMLHNRHLKVVGNKFDRKGGSR